MSGKSIIQTDDAPAAIGPYSQAVRSGELIFLSGQIPLDPETMQIVADDLETQARQVFSNLQAVAAAADSSLERAVKLTIYMTDLGHFSTVNEIMAEMLKPPYPARATIEVSALPKGALVEIDAILAG
ncbi:MAG: RidA family protein [Pseudomonadales bacterium]|jgi:reactive intermediate/imine deaminase|nr:RidA family protein [Pseudomonadales bacterium]